MPDQVFEIVTMNKLEIGMCISHTHHHHYHLQYNYF